MPFVDLESYASIKELAEQLGDQQCQTDVNPYPLFQRMALNLSLTLGYGFRIDGSAGDELLREIVTMERGISTLRSTSNNWQDFVPLLRILSRRNNEASELRPRRDTYLEYLLKKLKERIATGTDMPCITGNILKDPECKPTHSKTISSASEGRFLLISESAEIKSIYVSVGLQGSRILFCILILDPDRFDLAFGGRRRLFSYTRIQLRILGFHSAVGFLSGLSLSI